MDCEKCGGKVDKISTDNFFCRECGARHEIKSYQVISGQEPPKIQKPSGLLILVIILNYLVMALFLFYGIGLFFFFGSFTLILLIPAALLLWINLGLWRFESSKRMYSLILGVLFLVFIGIGFLGGSLFTSIILLIMIAFQYYVLYMHKPTVELFSRNR